ncbi:hypothetical protein AB0M46_44870 [Dactylosporangium sp. NPDC051485]|uniref:hypothetical protein n=1 Tax=Dactylosporangium sp. NPDC051485 TaxID=3154846 RepID=UPI003420CDF3
MLSPDTVHALAGWLLTAAEVADVPAPVRTRRPAAEPGSHRTRGAHRHVHHLLLLHDGPAPDITPDSRCMTCTPVPISRRLLDTHRRGLPDLLPDLATALHSPRTAATAPHGDTPHDDAEAVEAVEAADVAEIVAGLLATANAGMRLVACAVLYDDIHTGVHPDAATSGHNPGNTVGDSSIAQVTVVPVRRVDAVDVDGRVYQAICLPGAPATVVVDDEPDPHDTPATQPGLAALLTAARTGRRERRAPDGGAR